jgi:hypothetical protein
VTILGRNAVNAGIQLGMYYRRQSRSLLVFLLLQAMGACEPLVQIAKDRDAGVDEIGATGGSSATSSATGGSQADVASTGGTLAVAMGGSSSTVSTTGVAGSAVNGGAGGSSSTGPACTTATPCGGDIVGTWTVASSCVRLSGELDLTPLGMGCTSAPVTGSLQVSGTLTASSDGSSLSDNTLTTGSMQFTLAPPCMEISGTQVTCDNIGVVFPAVGFSSATCTSAAGGGCNCTGTVKQNGAMGALSESPFTHGTYSTLGNLVKTSDGTSSEKYSYCVSGNTLTVTPETTNPTATGTIVLKSGGTSCTNVTPCGGNVVGTWAVTSSCLTVGGGLDLTMLGIGCTSAPVAGSLQVSGTFTAKSDGSFVDNTTTTGSEQFTLAPSCMQISGTTATCDNIGVIFPAIGFASATCTSTGSGFCDCTGTVNQNGGMGLVDWNAATTGRYSTSSDVLKTTDGSSSWPYSYCASGNTLTMTPETMSPTTKGKIELQKQ